MAVDGTTRGAYEHTRSVLRWAARVAKRNPPRRFQATLYFRHHPFECNDHVHQLQQLGVSGDDIRLVKRGRDW